MVRAYAMGTRQTISVSTNGGAFHKGEEVLVYSLKKLIQCKAGNFNVKWTIPHYKRKRKRNLYLKKGFLLKHMKVELIGTIFNAKKG